VVRRSERKIPCLYIAEDSQVSRAVKAADQRESRKTKITRMMNEQEAECLFYGDKVVFVVFSQKEPIAVLVEDKEIARLQKLLFRNTWECIKVPKSQGRRR
jgi:hypothetical protein